MERKEKRRKKASEGRKSSSAPSTSTTTLPRMADQEEQDEPLLGALSVQLIPTPQRPSWRFSPVLPALVAAIALIMALTAVVMAAQQGHDSAQVRALEQQTATLQVGMGKRASNETLPFFFLEERQRLQE